MRDRKISAMFMLAACLLQPEAQAENKPKSILDPARQIEDEYWKRVDGSKDVADYQAYMREYPTGRYIPLAQLEAARLQRVRAPAPAVPAIAATPSAAAKSAMPPAPPVTVQAPAKPAAAPVAKPEAPPAAPKPVAASAPAARQTGTFTLRTEAGSQNVAISNRLAPGDGISMDELRRRFCGRKLWFAGLRASGNYRIFNCEIGADGFMHGSFRDDSPAPNNEGEFDWAFLVKKDDPTRLVVLPFNEFSSSFDSKQPAVAIVYRFPNGSGFSGMIGIDEKGRAVQGAGYGYASDD